MSAFDPPPAPADSEPGRDPSPSLPASGLWPDSAIDEGEGLPEADAASVAANAEAKPAGATGEPDTAAGSIGHIGRYALKSLIGEGGLGAVYAAHDPLLSRTIAIKTLNVQVGAGERESFNKLFLDEARAAGGLSHPHIVTVYDAGVSDDRVYIAMELLKGRDLRGLREDGWRPTPAQAALIARRVADALAFAHSKGVVHCDVKPANIFMVGRTQPRVLDFGIARIAHRRDGLLDASVAGSPYYMAPEQLLGRTIDRRTDVFSLGVVLYEMLTDRKPFRGASLEAITTAVIEHEPALACEIDPKVPKALAEITARAMAKDPEKRFRSARALSRELRQWLEEQALGEGQPAPRPARRWPWLAAAAVAGAFVGGGALWSVLEHRAAPALTAASVAATRTDDPSRAPAVRPAPATAAAAPEAAPSAPADAASAAPAPTADAVARGPTAATEAQTAAPAATAPPPAGNDTAARPAASPDAAANERRARPPRNAVREARPGPATAGPAHGIVRIAITPWGRVEVNGVPAGTTPPLAELSLAEGRHRITIRNADFPPYSTTVLVAPGRPAMLRHRFGS